MIGLPARSTGPAKPVAAPSSTGQKAAVAKDDFSLQAHQPDKAAAEPDPRAGAASVAAREAAKAPAKGSSGSVSRSDDDPALGDIPADLVKVSPAETGTTPLPQGLRTPHPVRNRLMPPARQRLRRQARMRRSR